MENPLHKLESDDTLVGVETLAGEKTLVVGLGGENEPWVGLDRIFLEKIVETFHVKCTLVISTAGLNVSDDTRQLHLQGIFFHHFFKKIYFILFFIFVCVL